MTLVFCVIVLTDEWADRTLPTHLSDAVIGPLSIVVWVLTLLGAFGIGPMGRLRAAMRL